MNDTRRKKKEGTIADRLDRQQERYKHGQTQEKGPNCKEGFKLNGFIERQQTKKIRKKKTRRLNGGKKSVGHIHINNYS